MNDDLIVQPTAAPSEPHEDSATAQQPSPAAIGDSALDTHHTVSKLRDLILNVATDLVPELIGGETVDELIASVDVARKAYSAIAGKRDQSSPAVHIPAGGGGRVPSVSMDDLSPTAKIAEGLRRRRG